MDAGVAVLVPVLRRPHRVASVAESFERTTRKPWRLVFICTEDDVTEQAAVRAAGYEPLVLPGPHLPGDYARKINYGYEQTGEPLLFLGADDIAPRAGWLEAAERRLEGKVHVVGTNDLGNSRVMNGEHSTHSLVTRDYVTERGTIDEPGKVLHEGYPHEYCDDEFIATAKKRRAFAFAFDSVVEHLHPMWGKAPTDELYDAEPERILAGRRIYRRRRRLWEARSRYR